MRYGLLFRLLNQKRNWFIFGLCLSLIINKILGFQTISLTDSLDYIDQGNQIHKYLFENGTFDPTKFFKPIGIPFIFAILKLIPSVSTILLFKILLCVLFAYTLTVAYDILQYIGTNLKSRSLALVFICINPFILTLTTNVQSEIFQTATISVFVRWLFVAQDRVEGRKTFLVVCWSLLILTIRPNFVPITAFIISVCFLLTSRKRWNMILFFTSGFLILGYLYLLSLLYNEFVFFGVQGGVNAVTMCRYEFIPQITGMASSSTNASINQWNLDFIDEINKQVASGGLLSPSESSNVLTQYGLDFCLNHPLESIAILILKLIFFWRPSVVFGAYSPEVFWVSILFMLPTVIGGLIYIYKQFRSVPKANRAFKLILILLAIGDASILITPLQIRHRVAMFDVVLILFAARLFQQKYDDIMHLVARKCKANRE